jgi:hypothetical protein
MFEVIGRDCHVEVCWVAGAARFERRSPSKKAPRPRIGTKAEIRNMEL